jgi:4-alpha-glucanotransferase
MKFPRSSGILLHPTSLPGAHGIGELGGEAHRFADFLKDAGQTIWQMLPLGPTGYGDSPYQCFSAFAGNPLLINLDSLIQRGYLSAEDLNPQPRLPRESVDFGTLILWKLPLLKRAAATFFQKANGAERADYDAYCRRHSAWLDEFALFMALKESHDYTMWTQWEPELALREPAALERVRGALHEQIEASKFVQFELEREWQDLKAHCGRNGIRVMGDMPIYVAQDSSDVWAQPEMFELNPDGTPRVVAGVPPDYFSSTGQHWGNPIYNWQRHAQTGYQWWIRRFRRAFEMLDIVRLDHFRGFEAYYEIQVTETTAVNGSWVKGPGAALFESVAAELGKLPILAENLGVITPEVEELRSRFGFPGMAILQFAFGKDPQALDFKPHNYPRHLVAYTGTHDNDTAVGWWTSSGEDDSVRSANDVSVEMEFARQYLDTDGSEIHWVMIRTLMASVADTVIFPLQDVLGIGSEGRMNLPGTSSGNWRWRYRAEELAIGVGVRLRQMVHAYDRQQ